MLVVMGAGTTCGGGGSAGGERGAESKGVV